jgi:hypothetical protein
MTRVPDVAIDHSPTGQPYANNRKADIAQQATSLAALDERTRRETITAPRRTGRFQTVNQLRSNGAA